MENFKTFTPTTQVNEKNPEDTPVYLLGIEDHAPVVGKVMPDTPAMAAGLQPDDRIVHINQTPIVTWSQMTEIVRKSAGVPLEMQIERKGTVRSVSITPEGHTVTNPDGESLAIGRIGIQISPRGTVLRSSSWYLAPWDGLVATWGWCELTVKG